MLRVFSPHFLPSSRIFSSFEKTPGHCLTSGAVLTPLSPGFHCKSAMQVCRSCLYVFSSLLVFVFCQIDRSGRRSTCLIGVWLHVCFIFIWGTLAVEALLIKHTTRLEGLMSVSRWGGGWMSGRDGSACCRSQACFQRLSLQVSSWCSAPALFSMSARFPNIVRSQWYSHQMVYTAVRVIFRTELRYA